MEHLRSTNVQFDSYDKLVEIDDLLSNDKLHVATWLSHWFQCVKIGTRPRLFLPSCKKGNNFELQKSLFSGLLNALSEDPYSKIGPVYVLGTDGDSRRPKAFG